MSNITKIGRHVTIDQEVYDRARAANINISREAENGIALYLQQHGLLEMTPREIMKEEKEKRRGHELKKVIYVPVKKLLEESCRSWR